MHEHCYHSTVTQFIRTLTALQGVLKQGKAFATEKKVAEEVFLKSRLAVDMFDFTKQVQVACDNAKGSTARLAGMEAPKMEDNEKTFAELDLRIEKTIAFMRTIPKESFVDAGERKIVLPYFSGKHFIGHEYIFEYAIPNFFFHVVTAYDILRHLGVDVKKTHYLGAFTMHDD